MVRYKNRRQLIRSIQIDVNNPIMTYQKKFMNLFQKDYRNMVEQNNVYHIYSMKNNNMN